MCRCGRAAYPAPWAGYSKRLARGDALVVVPPLKLDAGKAVRRRGMGVARGDVRLVERSVRIQEVAGPPRKSASFLACRLFTYLPRHIVLLRGGIYCNTGKKCKRKTRLQHSPRHDRFKSASAPTLDRDTALQRRDRKAYSRARARRIHSWHRAAQLSLR